MSTAKNWILRHLPRGLVRWVKSWYYPSVLRRFQEENWPGAPVVRRLISPGDTVVDAGANIGYVSMLLARWVGPRGRVHSFEPVPETFSLLSGNMRRLGLQQVEPHPIALSDQAGTAHMHVPQYEKGGENFYESHLATEPPGPGERSVTVRVETLDAVLRDRPRVTFMKLDVEGHELSALRGAKRILDAHRPALYVEMMGDLDRPGDPAAQLVDWLASWGYRVFRADGASVHLRQPGEQSVDYFFLTADHERRLQTASQPT